MPTFDAPSPSPRRWPYSVTGAKPGIPRRDLPYTFLFVAIVVGLLAVALAAIGKLSMAKESDLKSVAGSVQRAPTDGYTPRVASVLLAYPFIANVMGWVFKADPATLGGPTAKAGNASLNRWRMPVNLEGLYAPVKREQALSGDRVKVADVSTPKVAPPTKPPGKDFKYDARSNDFAAVNAYYNVDRIFGWWRIGPPHRRLFSRHDVSKPGRPSWPFRQNPLRGDEINAHCAGNAAGTGIDYTIFALADLDDQKNPIGIAGDWRIALHELLGHGVLYNHIGNALFKFAHSRFRDQGRHHRAGVHGHQSRRRRRSGPGRAGDPRRLRAHGGQRHQVPGRADRPGHRPGTGRRRHRQSRRAPQPAASLRRAGQRQAADRAPHYASRQARRPGKTARAQRLLTPPRAAVPTLRAGVRSNRHGRLRDHGGGTSRPISPRGWSPAPARYGRPPDRSGRWARVRSGMRLRPPCCGTWANVMAEPG